MPTHGGERKRSGGRAWRTEEEEGGGPVGRGWVPGGGAWREGSGWPATTRRGGGGRWSGDTQKGEEEGVVRSGGPRLEERERGGTWAAPGTHGPAEEKENRSGPKKQCNFLLNKK
jgi:hypothetical protein